MKEILIIGPIGDVGGREMEAGFIASALSNNFKISVCSTANITKSSQLYHYPFKGEVISLKEIIYRNYISLRPATILSYLKNGRKLPVHYYVNNKFNTFNGFKIREKKQLEKVIRRVDVVFIIAHLFSMRTKEIINIASEGNKKVIFRTTGLIEERGTFPDYLEKVTHYLHHSQVNADRLHNRIKNQNYSIVDQSAPNEGLLLQISPVKRQPRIFAAIGRFSSEKNFIYLISAFKHCCENSDKLFLIGDGELKDLLLEEKGDCENIILMGQMKSEEVAAFFSNIDCLIIPSKHEAGPLVAMEAMAAARIIISTPVGAMLERLENTGNDFWFDPTKKETFEREFRRLKNTSANAVLKISSEHRNRYLQSYSQEKVSNLYIHTIDYILKNS